MDVFQKITDAPCVTCPMCQKDTLVRGPGGGVGLSFQGSGFYITDYSKKPQEAESTSTPKSNCGSHCKGHCK